MRLIHLELISEDDTNYECLPKGHDPLGSYHTVEDIYLVDVVKV